MNGDRQFVDTNVFVYAHDMTAGEKHSRARALVEELWDTRQGCLSVQVLQELSLAPRGRSPSRSTPKAAARVIEDLTPAQSYQGVQVRNPFLA